MKPDILVEIFTKTLDCWFIEPPVSIFMPFCELYNALPISVTHRKIDAKNGR